VTTLMGTRRDFLKTIWLGAAGLVVPRFVPASGSSKPKPNFVFILIDDMGWKDVGFMGSRYYETPSIDRLAGQGIVFTDAYTNAPNCAPTRACILSGQYTPRHGVYTVGSSQRGPAKFRKLVPIPNETKLASSFVTIAEALKPAGYVSASIGKWHLGDDPELGPVGQGFDVNVAGYRAGHPASYFSPYKNPKLEDGPKGEYLTDRLTDEATRFIERNREKPFFLYLPHYAVHTPLQAKKALIEKYRNKKGSGGQHNPTYAAMIESTDRGVGRIMAKLDELKLADNTVVLFFSDNGGVGGYRALGIEGQEITSNSPLRGGKGMLYEGGIRVPMIVRWPGEARPGSVCNTPVVGIDFYRTFLEMAGAQKRPRQILDGESLVRLLKQSGTLKRDAIFWHFPCYLEGGHGTWRTTPAGAIRQGDLKLIEFFEDNRLELYNLRDDIGEKHDLAKVMPEKARQLHRRLVEWRKSVGAPVPSKPNPGYDPEAKPDSANKRKKEGRKRTAKTA